MRTKVIVPVDVREMNKISKLIVTGKFRKLNLSKVQSKTDLRNLKYKFIKNEVHIPAIKKPSTNKLFLLENVQNAEENNESTYLEIKNFIN